jgi:hypothetical protein
MKKKATGIKIITKEFILLLTSDRPGVPDSFTCWKAYTINKYNALKLNYFIFDKCISLPNS